MDLRQYDDFAALFSGHVIKYNDHDIGSIHSPARKAVCKYIALNFLAQQRPLNRTRRPNVVQVYANWSRLRTLHSSTTSPNQATFASSVLADLKYCGFFEPLNQGEFEGKGLERDLCDSLRAHILSQSVVVGCTPLWFRLSAIANIYYVSRSPKHKDKDTLLRIGQAFADRYGQYGGEVVSSERKLFESACRRNRELTAPAQWSSAKIDSLLEKIRQETLNHRVRRMTSIFSSKILSDRAVPSSMLEARKFATELLRRNK